MQLKGFTQSSPKVWFLSQKRIVYWLCVSLFFTLTRVKGNKMQNLSPPRLLKLYRFMGFRGKFVCSPTDLCFLQTDNSSCGTCRSNATQILSSYVLYCCKRYKHPTCIIISSISLQNEKTPTDDCKNSSTIGKNYCPEIDVQRPIIFFPFQLL